MTANTAQNAARHDAHYAKAIGQALTRSVPLPCADDDLAELMALADRLVTNCQDVPRTDWSAI